MTGNPKAILINDTRSECHHGCSTVYETIAQLAKRSTIDILATAPVHRDWRTDKRVLAAFDECDVVIVNGEGTIHHDRPAGRWLLAAGELARSTGKKSALINTTWQENGPALIELAHNFDIVSVRESASECELRSHGINARRIPDLALYRQCPPADRRSGVSYTDSVLGPVALDIYKRMRALKARPVSLLFDRRTLRQFLGLARRYVPGADAANPMKLIQALRAAAIDWNAQTSDRSEFARQVASSELVVTGRFHMLIYALSTLTPVLVVGSNTHKNRATLVDSGLGAWRHIEPADINEALLERARHWDDGELQRLRNYRDTSRREMEILFDDIRGLV